MEPNQEKYESYKRNFERLNKALKNNFYFEAIVVEYAVMEDRMQSILSYEGNEIKPKQNEYISITRKKNRIKKLSEKKNSLIGKYYSEALFEKINDWIKDRNALFHALLRQKYNEDAIKNIAEVGFSLSRELINLSKKYKRAVINQKNNFE